MIFGFCTISSVLSLFSLWIFKKTNTAPTKIIVLLAGSYSLLLTNLIMMVFLLIHLNPSVWFVFHFHNLMLKSNIVIASFAFVKIDYMSIFILIAYPLLLFVIFVISQTILLVASICFEDDIDINYINRIQNLISNNPWMRGCEIKIINDEKIDAFAFTTFKINRLKIRKINMIILTNSVLDRVDNDELEVIIAHEYAHTKEFQTIFSNILIFISSLFIFIPIFRATRKLIWTNNEIKADQIALEFVNKPLSLARALFKLFVDVDPISNDGLSSEIQYLGNDKLIINRINILITYAELNNIQL